MEQWTVEHAGAFVLGLAMIYGLWMLAIYVKPGRKMDAVVFNFTTLTTVAILLLLAAIANEGLGVSGAIAALLGGIIGLQMAILHDSRQVRKETDKKPLKEEE